MVTGGTISVIARLDTLPVHADTIVSVQARRWPSMSVVAVDSGNGPLPAYPTLTRQLADRHPPIPSGPIPSGGLVPPEPSVPIFFAWGTFGFSAPR